MLLLKGIACVWNVAWLCAQGRWGSIRWYIWIFLMLEKLVCLAKYRGRKEKLTWISNCITSFLCCCCCFVTSFFFLLQLLWNSSRKCRAIDSLVLCFSSQFMYIMHWLWVIYVSHFRSCWYWQDWICESSGQPAGTLCSGVQLWWDLWLPGQLTVHVVYLCDIS